MAVQLTYHGTSPTGATGIMNEGFKMGRLGSIAPGQVFSSNAPGFASGYGQGTVRMATPTSTFSLPSKNLSTGVTGREFITSPKSATRMANLASKLGTQYTGPTAGRLAAGQTVGGLGGSTTLGLGSFLGGQIATGLPLGYVALADALQGRLEDQGLTGEGGIYDLSGGWGAMGAGADIPVIQKMLADRRATKKGIAEANMQRKIQEAEAAAAQAAAAAQVRANIQRYGNRDRPDRGMNAPGGGKGQSPTGGNVSGTPFSRGGLATMFQRR
jgi:hypothetical protein